MALMLLTVAIFFNYVISFQLGLAVPLFCRPAERRPTKHQEEPSVGEVFFFFWSGGGRVERGRDVWCVSAAKLLSPPEECEQRPVAGFH